MRSTGIVSIGGTGGNRRDPEQYNDGGGGVMKLAGLVVLASVVVTATAQSGAAGFFNPLSTSRDGIHLYGVSVYTGYFSGGIPFEVSSINTLPNSGATAVSGGSANFGWSRTRDGSSLTITETLAFMAYPERTLQPTTAFSLGWSRTVKLGQKWSINVSAAGHVTDLEQSYFAANSFGLAASLPTTFDALSGAILTGKSTDVQLASALTGASAPLSPEQAYLYGRRVASASLTAGVSYAFSGRSSFHASVSATRMQSLNFGGTTQTTIQPLIPQTTGGSVSLGWGYSLTPRTQIGLEAVTSRAFSHLQDAYSTAGGFSIGRTMSEHWFVQGRIGTGVVTYLRQTTAATSGINPQYTAGGSIGYKLRSHTLLASFDRSIGDSYGLGSASTSGATAGWVWKAPGSSWSLSANYGYQQLNASAVRSNESWRATGGIARALDAHMFISLQYAYFTFPPSVLLLNEVLGTQSGVTMSLSWSPSQYR